MIIIKMIGGLGNQMFQYALGRNLSIIHKTSLRLDISEYEHLSFRKFSLDHFNIRAELEKVCNLPIFGRKIYHIEKWLLFNYPTILKLRRPSYSFISEKHFHYDPEILKLPDKVFLNGYWQSEKYFIRIKEIIKKEFTLKKSSHSLKKYKNWIQKDTTVSIHIRRGDYKNDSKNVQFHGICGLDYYYKAIQLIKQKFKKCRFYVFSDDISWVKNNLRTENEVNYISSAELKDYEEFYLMSLCKHNILANSTFSWWAAWLNNNQNKIIITPKQWFKDRTIDTKDLIPKGWNRI